ncbi:Uncharacterised protein [Mycobacteroides abscessus subsp. abscessus]|nr:Uncharacterised protein [Mycobacteroides abscessus subsp. abscessus]
MPGSTGRRRQPSRTRRRYPPHRPSGARVFLQSDCGTDYVVRPAGFGGGKIAGFVHAQRCKDIVLHINI